MIYLCLISKTDLLSCKEGFLLITSLHSMWLSVFYFLFVSSLVCVHFWEQFTLVKKKSKLIHNMVTKKKISITSFILLSTIFLISKNHSNLNRRHINFIVCRIENVFCFFMSGKCAIVQILTVLRNLHKSAKDPPVAVWIKISIFFSIIIRCQFFIVFYCNHFLNPPN